MMEIHTLLEKPSNLIVLCLQLDESDFFIFPLPFGYIPYWNFNWRKQPLEALVYHCDVFAEQFNIADPRLLLLLPAIIGNKKTCLAFA